MPEQREIVLIPVPFTDLSSTKRRPVLIISATAYNNASPDVIVAAITSNLQAGSTGIVISTADMEAGTLPVQSLVRSDKIYTLSQRIIIKKYGKLNTTRFEEALQELDKALGR